MKITILKSEHVLFQNPCTLCSFNAVQRKMSKDIHDIICNSCKTELNVKYRPSDVSITI